MRGEDYYRIFTGVYTNVSFIYRQYYFSSEERPCEKKALEKHYYRSKYYRDNIWCRIYVFHDHSTFIGGWRYFCLYYLRWILDLFCTVQYYINDFRDTEEKLVNWGIFTPVYVFLFPLTLVYKQLVLES